MANSSEDAGALVLLLVGGIVLYNCSGPSADEQLVADELGVSTEEAASLIGEYGDPYAAIEDYREDTFDEDAAREAAEAELASEGYDYSYGCTDDCSGHEAGWQWRAENGYAASGDSNSFDEGGRAFDEALEERVEEMRNEYVEEGHAEY